MDHTDHQAHGDAEAPAEPGYPEHPEQKSAAGDHPHAVRVHAAQDAHVGHDAHSGHDKHAGRLVTVLVIACPHALGLAIPLVIAISTTLGARNGLLVRDRRGLEAARNIDAVVFDKTGTLTRGEFGVVDIATSDGLSTDDALRMAAAVEADSEHTIAQGIVRSAHERGVPPSPAEEFEAIPGKGVRATVDGRELYMGGPALVKALSLDVPTLLRQATERASQSGRASIYLAEQGRAIAAFTVADVIRPESREAIRALHDQGIEVVMMTATRDPSPKRWRENSALIPCSPRCCRRRRRRTSRS